MGIITWYSGTVASAINEAKRRGTTFIVAIVDENGSLDFVSVLESFSGELSRGVCVKYLANSVEARQFGEFYPVVLIPSLYFIDSSNGINLETTGGHADPDKIRISIQKGLKITIDEQVSERLSEEATLQTTSSELLQETDKKEEEAASASPMEVTEVASTTELSLEERVARAKELLRKKNEEKVKESKEDAKSKEMDRRTEGKSLQKFKDEQEEASVRKALEERKREKEADRLARERVKAQIAQDRADKAKKFNAEKEELQRQREEKERLAAEKQVAAARVLEAESSKSARIQFRLPDGRTHNHVFDAEAHLSDVFSYVNDNVDRGFSAFSLSTTFPVKKLDSLDQSTSLKSHELAPSATIMVLPKTSSSSYPVQSSGSILSYFWLLLSPLTFILSAVQSFLTGGNATTDRGGENEGENPPTRSNARPKTAYKRKSDGGQVRREGNIARLSNEMDNDDDDENGTWNGNSTQQM